MSQWQKHAMLDNPWRGQKGVNSLQVCTPLLMGGEWNSKGGKIKQGGQPWAKMAMQGWSPNPTTQGN